MPHLGDYAECNAIQYRDYLSRMANCEAPSNIRSHLTSETPIGGFIVLLGTPFNDRYGCIIREVLTDAQAEVGRKKKTSLKGTIEKVGNCDT